jgi:hypothetical protein
MREQRLGSRAGRARQERDIVPRLVHEQLGLVDLLGQRDAAARGRHAESVLHGRQRSCRDNAARGRQ